MKKILALFILGLLVGCSSTDEGIFTKSGTMYVDYPVTYRQPVAFEDSDVTINGTTIGTGGGSVTGQVYRIYADSQANMFANQPSTYQLTNSTLSTTHIMAGFDKDTKELFGADIVYLPSNFNSNVLISASIHTAGTTNLTAAMYFWYSDGANTYELTNNITLTSDDISNQQLWQLETNIANAVAGERIYWSVGIVDTNTSSTTRDGTIYMETVSCEFFSE